MKKTTVRLTAHGKALSTVGGVVTAVVASLCCIGPVVVALIGVGSIGAFSAFEAYRPYLIGVTVAVLGLAFYLTYRKREVKCANGSCTAESAGKWNKISVWAATVIAAVALAFPYFGASLLATASTVPQQLATQSVEYATTILNVDGMDCKACAKGVEGSLAGIKGVRKASVEFEQGQALVEYDPAIVQPSAFVDRVNESGFTARIVAKQKGE
jgi:copper chaperone CopZ